MTKTVMAMIGVVLATVLLGGVAGADSHTDGAVESDVVLPDAEGTCPAGFELGYSDEFGEVCTETLERDGDGAAAVTPAAGAAGALPRTGSDSSLPLAQLGAVLVAVGGLVVLVTRKRAAHTA